MLVQVYAWGGGTYSAGDDVKAFNAAGPEFTDRSTLKMVMAIGRLRALVLMVAWITTLVTRY